MFIEGCPGFSDDAAYRAMDFLLAALEEIAERDLLLGGAPARTWMWTSLFVDTTSTYWEMEVAAELAETAGEDENDDEPARRGGRAAVRRTARTTGTTCRRW